MAAEESGKGFRPGGRARDCGGRMRVRQAPVFLKSSARGFLFLSNFGSRFPASICSEFGAGMTHSSFNMAAGEGQRAPAAHRARNAGHSFHLSDSELF